MREISNISSTDKAASIPLVDGLKTGGKIHEYVQGRHESVEKLIETNTERRSKTAEINQKDTGKISADRVVFDTSRSGNRKIADADEINESKAVKTAIKNQVPLQILIYGNPGTGKSTFAANADNACVIDLEGRAIQVKPDAKVSLPIIGYNQASKLMFDRLNQLLTRDIFEKRIVDRGYKTIIVDSLSCLQEYFLKEAYTMPHLVTKQGMLQLIAYSSIQKKLAEIIDKLIQYSLSYKLDLIFVAHTLSQEKHLESGEIYTVETIDLASKVIPNLCRKMSYIFYLQKAVRNREVQVLLHTEADDKVCKYAKSQKSLREVQYDLSVTSREHNEIMQEYKKFWDEEVYKVWREHGA